MLLHYPYGGRHVVTHVWTVVLSSSHALNRKTASAKPQARRAAHGKPPLWNICPPPPAQRNETISNVYRTSIEHLSNIYQTSIEHRSSTCRTYRESIDAPGGGNNNNNNKDNDKNIEKNQPPPPNRPVPPFPPKLCMVSPTKIFYRTYGHLMEIN